MLNRKKQDGQAAVFLLIITIVGITIATTATLLIATNSLNASMFQEGLSAYQMAENGAENAMIRILRNPSYTGETINENGGTVLISVSGDNPKFATSTATVNNHQRRIELRISNTNGVFNITSWKEIF